MDRLIEPLPALESMRKYPQRLYFRGRKELLKRKMVSIVGSRRPTQYAAQAAYRIANELAKRGVTVVSGGAMGIDAAAHRGAGPRNSVAVLPCGIDIRYPAVNAALLDAIAAEGVLLSQFEPGFRAAAWSFVVRNELVVALGSALVVAEAEADSGSMRSVEFALKMGKKIYVLPHRLGESEGTNRLLQSGKAEAIYDIDRFAEIFSEREPALEEDAFMRFCAAQPTYEEALEKFGELLFEAELEGRITVCNGRILPV
ncbi:DNA-processing protein DprA [Hydrogenimonas sp.]